MPWLFPYGCGGAEDDDRPSKLSLKQWIQHCLNFHDNRFRIDPSFIFVAYKVCQIREKVANTRILFNKMLGPNGVASVNEPSRKDFQAALKVLAEKKTLYNSMSPEITRVMNLAKNISIIGAQAKDSVYSRNACRDQIMGTIVAHGLPNFFITLNPSDITNPIISFWNGTGEETFDLDTLMPEDLFPDARTRARLVAEDPVHCSKMFHTVISAFLRGFWAVMQHIRKDLYGYLY